jgi:hypothetical protein
MDVVRRETYALIRATNLSNETALSYLQNKYADEVGYYGKYFSRDEVVNDKKTFFLRWPNRNYSIDPGSLVVGCERASSCRADGTFTWSDRGNGLTSVGSATFSFGWALTEGDIWRINSETSQVLKRQVSRSERTGATLSPVATSSSSPRYQVDAAASKVIALSNLSSDCSPGGSLTGKIVHREFAKDGLSVTGFVIEAADGTRTFVNVDVDLNNSDQVTRSWVMKGLQTLLVEGRSTEIGFRACGAAGRVLELDAAR